MDVLTDDHEREQVVRKWWHENWKPIALGIVIALGGLVGFRQYQAYTLEKAQQQSYELFQLQYKLASAPTTSATEAQKYLDEHQDIYGALLALDLAGYEAARKDFEAAAKHAAFAVKNGGELIVPSASLSLARIQGQLKQYAEAIKTLDNVSSDAYAIEKAEIKGDILLAKGDKDGAREAYKQSMQLCKDQKLQISPLLVMKLDDVAKEGDEPAYVIARDHNLSLNSLQGKNQEAK